jgi:PhzF family phenazine biosynthesis protein
MKPNKILYQVDAFTSEPFKGNPAGVCIIKKEVTKEWMQNIATEMNLSETAFVIPGKSVSKIRFFTPESEVPLCGHATLSASHIMYECGIADRRKEIAFSSKAGNLTARISKKWITLNFPVYSLEPINIPSGIDEIIDIMPVELYRAGYGWTLALLNNEQEVRNLKPNFPVMKNSEFGDLIITAPSSDSAFDFCVRCFAPALGINEDPVTGSAHCALVPFWHMKTGRNEFNSHQVSKRTGILKVLLRGDRTEISGQAITIFKADLFV